MAIRLRGANRAELRNLLGGLSLSAIMALSLSVPAVFSARIASHFGIGSPRTLLTAQASLIEPQASGSGSRAIVLDLASEAAPVRPSPTPATTSASPSTRPAGSIWLPILMYHYVRFAPLGDRLGFNLSVTPPDFQRQMQYLRDQGYVTLTMRDADLIITKQKPLPSKAIVLTFDDGYIDFFTTAAPVLRALGMTATDYIPTRLADTPRYMSWSQIEELDEQGFEMAAHTMYHVALAHQSPGRLLAEVDGSKSDLENHLGHPVVDFAFPYGSFDGAAIQAVRKAGFWSATTTVPGGWHNPTQMYVLTRIRVGGGEPFDFWVRTLAPSL